MSNVVNNNAPLSEVFSIAGGVIGTAITVGLGLSNPIFAPLGAVLVPAGYFAGCELDRTSFGKKVNSNVDDVRSSISKGVSYLKSPFANAVDSLDRRITAWKHTVNGTQPPSPE